MDLQLNPAEELLVALHLSLMADSMAALEMCSMVVTNVHRLHISTRILRLEKGVVVSDKNKDYNR